MWDALLIWIRDRVLRFFDIRLGEHRRVLQMQLHIFLIIQCLWIIKPVANAQFLSKAGIEKLPLVFVFVAISALIVTTVYSHLQNRWPLTIIIARTYQFSIAALLSIGLLLNFQLFEDWMSYFFYIGGGFVWIDNHLPVLADEQSGIQLIGSKKGSLVL
jgi:AAA family ATP:ADP antiporter